MSWLGNRLISFAHGVCRASYTTSLATSVTAYKEHAGRRFHAYKEGCRAMVVTSLILTANFYAAYIFPNDEKEQDRLDITHKMMEVAFHGPWRAPVKNPKRVLDLGTGTGIWALEFGELTVYQSRGLRYFSRSASGI